jgi:hypothetical protein
MKNQIRILHWAPRILAILAILFVSIFALDAFGPGRSIWQQIGDFMIHLIPVYFLLATLIVAWKWELIGGIIFLAIGIITLPYIYAHNYQMNHSIGISLFIVLVINIPFMVCGFLFIICDRKKKAEQVKDFS